MRLCGPASCLTMYGHRTVTSMRGKASRYFQRQSVAGCQYRIIVSHEVIIDLETNSIVGSADCSNFVGDGFLGTREGRCSDGVPS